LTNNLTNYNYTMNELREKIIEANEAYRTGESIISDAEYDALIDQLPEDDPLRNKVGIEVSGDRKEKLPYPMYSMDKIKTIDELHSWYSSMGITSDTELVITPKYDGLSFLVSDEGAFTRGDGIEGQRSDAHLKVLNSSKTKLTKVEGVNIIGEVIMKKIDFHQKYAEDYKNPRNLVAGMFNKKEPQESLKDVQFVCYGTDEDIDKKETLDTLNGLQDIEVPYMVIRASNMVHDTLEKLYEDWGMEFEIDGLIIEVNDATLRKRIGRERNNNPAYARAYKGFKAKSVWTTIKSITYGVSKEGKMCPVAQVEPVNLGGVTISNVTLNNPKFVRENGITTDMRVEIIRSGDVIPKVINVEPLLSLAELPKECPCCGSKVEWDDTETFLMCRNNECPDQQLYKMISFFEILGVDNVGEGVCKQLYEAGYKTVQSVLELTIEDLKGLEGFGNRKAEIVYTNIHKKMKDVPLEKLQHATSMFKGLGSKKLKLLNGYDSIDNIPTKEQILAVEGYSEKSADVYLENIQMFWSLIHLLPVTIKEKVEVAEGGKCEGMVVVFTGVRDKDAEAKIEALGGKIGGSVSSKTTHLVCKDKESNSGKVKKAKALGTCEIWELEDITNFIN
jgi:DNA ligase (NAD+)